MTDAAPPLNKAPGGDDLRGRIIEVLKTIRDPEIPVNIYELGLVYEIDITPDNNVRIFMTLTSPMCPVAVSLPVEVDARTRGVEGVGDVRVELVWDPPWSMERMSEAARLQLGLD
ncbi:MAG: DUF59 domain-containing protein [bacterium]|nr:DUF59 domain-containing protein [Candidatus Sumerlaeota bacterium]